MKLQRTFTVTCCDFKFSSAYEYEALNELMNHIQQFHPGIDRQLSENARQLAMCQNGRGYFDDGKSKSKKSGWFRSQDTFKHAWRRSALERMLDKQLSA